MTHIHADSISVASKVHHHESPHDWKRYFSFSTDHKVIGIQYLVLSFIFFLSVVF